MLGQNCQVTAAQMWGSEENHLLSHLLKTKGRGTESVVTEMIQPLRSDKKTAILLTPKAN